MTTTKMFKSIVHSEMFNTARQVGSNIILIVVLTGCGGGGGDASNGPVTEIGTTAGCFFANYPEPATSQYILPYPVGMAFSISQGNCGIFTHLMNCVVNGFACGDIRYAYDHDMPVGIVILASRAGTVVSVEDRFPNGTNDFSQTNFILIQHNDGSVGRYLHINPSSAMVTVGQVVSQGDPIAISGDSGNTGINNPHLHFDVVVNESPTCRVRIDFSDCRTLPVVFRNAAPLDAPLMEGDILYEALTF